MMMMMKRNCELCKKSEARIRCEADQASLCWGCDSIVHGANFLVARHSRSLLCRRCHSLTPWSASGSKLPPTFSACEACEGTGDKTAAEEEEERDMVWRSEGGGENEIEVQIDADDEKENDYQVVPWRSTPPPPPPPLASASSSSSSSSSEESSSDGEIDSLTISLFKKKRKGCSRLSSQKNRGCVVEGAAGMGDDGDEGPFERPVKVSRIEVENAADCPVRDRAGEIMRRLSGFRQEFDAGGGGGSGEEIIGLELGKMKKTAAF